MNDTMFSVRALFAATRFILVIILNVSEININQ